MEPVDVQVILDAIATLADAVEHKREWSPALARLAKDGLDAARRIADASELARAESP